MPVPPCFRRRSPALPTQPAGVERRNAAARGLLAIVGGAWLAAAMASDRVELQTTDHRLVTGRVVREAQDDSLLIEHDDGRYELLGPVDIALRSSVTGPPVRERPSEFGRRVLAELPAGFDLLVTKHYVVCFDTTREYAKWCAALFERLYDAFGNYWSRAGVEVTDPERPLVVVIFADRRAYETHAAADLGAAADRVVGYYNLLSNRITTFDLTGSDQLAAERGRQPGRVGLEILSHPAAAGLVSTLVHEASHQLAFNNGMHRRLAPVPLWVSEGVATYFETPDLEHVRAWRAVGAVNRPRLDRFLETYRPGCVEAVVRGDDAFRDPDRAVDAYATAWAVCHHLLKVRKSAFVNYLRELAVKQPLDEDSPETRLDEFRAAFGDPAAVEEAVMKAMARLASRPR
jgi:hypothetical protein